jgi:hypothetical protein
VIKLDLAENEVLVGTPLELSVVDSLLGITLQDQLICQQVESLQAAVRQSWLYQIADRVKH